jgi:hypothetical protein
MAPRLAESASVDCIPGKGRKIMREWIMDDEQEESTFLIRRDWEGRLKGWQKADVSGVVDLLGDLAYAEAIGEDHDTLTVFVLTDIAAVPVQVTQVTHAPIGKVEVRLTWRDPYSKNPTLTGYRNMIEV